MTVTAADDERKLIEAARQGNHDAFQLLNTRVEPRLIQMIYRFVGNSEDAKVILQDVFVKAYRGLNGFRRDASFYTWMYRIAVRTCSKHLARGSSRIRARSEPLEPAHAEGLAERAKREFTGRQKSAREEAEEEERRERVRRAISALPAKYFEVVMLHHMEELSYEDVAEILKIPKGTVMSRAHRAEHLLLGKLKDEGLS